MTGGAKLARGLAWTGVAVFWVLLGTLTLVAGLPVLDAVLMSVLMGLMPVLALAQVPLIGQAKIDRMPAYAASILTLWFVGSACWLVGTRNEGAAALGVVGLPLADLFLWSVGLTGAGMAIIVVFRWVAGRVGAHDPDLLRELLPRTRSERQAFGVLSVAAGVCEELAYRGYAIPVLGGVIGVPAAAVVTSGVFGLLHGYQGWLGIGRTALMGGVLAYGFLASGSLWPPIVAHTAIDVLAGIVLGERLLSPPGDTGVPEADSR